VEPQTLGIQTQASKASTAALAASNGLFVHTAPLTQSQQTPSPGQHPALPWAGQVPPALVLAVVLAAPPAPLVPDEVLVAPHPAQRNAAR